MSVETVENWIEVNVLLPQILKILAKPFSATTRIERQGLVTFLNKKITVGAAQGNKDDDNVGNISDYRLQMVSTHNRG